MNSSILALATLAALAASPPAAGPAADSHDVTPAGPLSLTLEQEIEVHAKPIAGRTFSFDLTIASDPALPGVAVAIDGVPKATYTAHDMRQRLGTRQLVGRSFRLALADGGWTPAGAEPLPRIDLGPLVAEGFPLDGVLADVLPVRPPVPLALGATWTDRRPVRSLEGWSWAGGQLSASHRITAIDRQGSESVVTVESRGEATIGATGAADGPTARLSRVVRWSFDAADGRLLSLSLEQETEGSSAMPQGQIELRQTTRLDLVPRS